ncbi:MAG: GNAT family N-acetyltransferase [Bacteroidota bacterium]
MNYLFTSERLGFRNWWNADVVPMVAINQDPAVMRFFPRPSSPLETKAWVEKTQRQGKEKGYCYFAVELLASQELLGFIGLSDKDFAANFTPCVDIGWRLGKQFWGKGYATEGAQRCLTFAKEEIGLKKVYAIAPKVNQPSIRVMQKIGMQFEQEFAHPLLGGSPHLQPCVAYQLEL